VSVAIWQRHRGLEEPRAAVRAQREREAAGLRHIGRLLLLLLQEPAQRVARQRGLRELLLRESAGALGDAHADLRQHESVSE